MPCHIILMKTGRSISMESTVWTAIGERADKMYDGDVSATVEALCRDSLRGPEEGEDS